MFVATFMWILLAGAGAVPEGMEYVVLAGIACDLMTSGCQGIMHYMVADPVQVRGRLMVGGGLLF